MSNAANSAKTRWNAANYSQVKAFVDPKTAAAFKDACAGAGISMASALSRFMSEYGGEPNRNGAKRHIDCSTRKKRRIIVERACLELEQVMTAEESFVGNAPENLRGAPIYEAAEQDISALEMVIEQLREIY